MSDGVGGGGDNRSPTVGRKVWPWAQERTWSADTGWGVYVADRPEFVGQCAGGRSSWSRYDIVFSSYVLGELTQNRLTRRLASATASRRDARIRGICSNTDLVHRHTGATCAIQRTPHGTRREGARHGRRAVVWTQRRCWRYQVRLSSLSLSSLRTYTYLSIFESYIRIR